MILYIILGVIGFIILFLIILSLPRKENERIHNIEAIDNPDVVKGFETMAKTPAFAWIHKKIVSKLTEFLPEGIIVDLGCGSGNLIVRLAKKFPNSEIIGVDNSSEMLKTAKERAEKKIKSRKIKFKKGSANKLPFNDNSIDFVVSSLSLHHWINPTEALQEIYRVLKKHGYLIIFDFRRNSRKFFYGLLKFATTIVVPKALKDINEPLGSLLSSYTENEMREIFNHTSFDKIDIEALMAWVFIIAKKNKDI